MKYLAVLGRQPEISVAELEALFGEVKQITGKLAVFHADKKPEIDRLGGSLKLAELIEVKPLDYLRELAEGKITLGVSDFSRGASKKTATIESLKLKKILVRHGRSVRVVENKDAVISTATSLHHGLSGKNERKVELIKVNDEWYKVIGVQDIDAYTKRDQARPARDAKVGMLPPKLAQILINLCGDLPTGSRVLDPFCGTGVVLQEALLMGYQAYGTDINERMVEYTEKNLEWLVKSENMLSRAASGQPVATGDRRSSSLCQAPDSLERCVFQISQGDATSFQWEQPIDAVACEGYLGRPMSAVPAEIKLKTEKQECKAIMVGFLKNLASQIKSGTPVVVAMPAWLREDGSYSRLEILDEITDMGYNVYNKSREGLLYHREGQIVARDLIILRKD